MDTRKQSQNKKDKNKKVNMGTRKQPQNKTKWKLKVKMSTKKQALVKMCLIKGKVGRVL